MRKIWEPAAQIMIDGDYYPLIDSHESAKEYYACQFDDPENRKGFFQVIRNVLTEEDSVNIKMYADPDATYRFTCMDPEGEVVIKGKDLLKKGFDIRIPKRSSVIWFYTKE